MTVVFKIWKLLNPSTLVFLIKEILLIEAKIFLSPTNPPGPKLTIKKFKFSSFNLLCLKKSKRVIIKFSLFKNLSLTKTKSELFSFAISIKLPSVKSTEQKLEFMASFIKKTILITFLIIANLSPANAQEYQNEKGIIGLMYHRFEENKYPSTNVRIKEFNLQLEIIKQNNLEFISIDELRKILIENKNYESKKVLITVDDAFKSFYENGWKVLREKKIPFILFLNTREVNTNNPNYMTWDQIREIHNSKIGTIGGHTFSHGYLVNKSENEIRDEIEKSHKDYQRELNFIPKYFSYPYGEYSSAFKKIVKEFNYELAFGQHSGVIDKSKDLLELPRYPVNESYGKAERFLTLLNTKPFPFKSFKPENKFIKKSENPPKIEIEFYKEMTKLEKINCFANDGGEWSKKKITFIEKNWIRVNLDKKFKERTGRINCSLLDNDKQFRWLGFQFVIDGN